MKPINHDTAEFTAFLVLGAVHAKAEFDEFGGQIGFVQHCIPYARKIAKRLADVYDDSHEWPGVLAYELIEPLGARIAADRSITPAALADDFARSYLAWIADEV